MWFLFFFLIICLTFIPFKVWVVDLVSNIGIFVLSASGVVQALVFFFLVSMISLLVFFWARFYMHKKGLSWFFSMLFVFVFSMVLLIISGSLFLVFLGWEGLGISSFILIIFYQNWVSVNGGLLTLLINRMGDACLVISFSYWAVSLSHLFNFNNFVLGMIYILAFTKSAQWPFSSWLPAAMAAPTPVSALVHSSTLVTAGSWVLIRFFSDSSSALLLSLGSFTMLMAGFAALLETDAKKIVALSTLSQLGLMMVALHLGGKLVCFFHLICHALAKANLFLVIGSLLSLNYSQQDSRKLSVNTGSLSMALIVSTLSLSGAFFQSGMYSKEQILLMHHSLVNSILSWISFFVLLALTVSYCFKLLSVCFFGEEKEKAASALNSKTMYLPILLLSMASMFFGSFFHKNAATWYNVGAFSNYFTVLLTFFVLSIFVFLTWGFTLQSLVSKSPLVPMLKSMTLSFSMIESMYFILLSTSETFAKKGFNILMPFTLIFLTLLFF